MHVRKRHEAPHETMSRHLIVWLWHVLVMLSHRWLTRIAVSHCCKTRHAWRKKCSLCPCYFVDWICVNYCGDCHAQQQISITDLCAYIIPSFSYVLVAGNFAVINITLIDLYSFAPAQQLIVSLILLLQNCIIHPVRHSLAVYPLITADTYSSRPSHPSMYL